MAEYFEQVRKVKDVRKTNINVVGDYRMSALGKLNESSLSIGEVQEDENEIKQIRSRLG